MPDGLESGSTTLAAVPHSNRLMWCRCRFVERHHCGLDLLTAVILRHDFLMTGRRSPYLP